MKQTISFLSGIVLFFIALFAYTKLVGPIPFSVTQTTINKTDLFSVTGTGKVSVKPDVARITAGIQSTAATVKDAQNEMNKVINAVSDAVKKVGVDAKDIQTTNYTIYPVYDYQNSQQRITGYHAGTNLEIKVRDLTKANAALDAATANGANTIGGISFEVSDKEKAENEARTKAVDDAKKKALDAARIAGFSLGKIINYQENAGNNTFPRPMYAGLKAGGGADIAAPSTELQSGSEEIQMTVTLSYEIQ